MGGGHDVPAPTAVGWYSYLLHRPCKLQETEHLLKSSVHAGEEFVRVKYGDEVLGWDHLRLTEHARQELGEYDLLRGMGKGGCLVGSCLDDPVNATKALELADRCCDGERFVNEYNVIAAKGTDADQTEEFLRQVVEEPHRLYREERDGEFVEWCRLTMDRVTKEEVEKYHGIKSVGPVQKIVHMGFAAGEEDMFTQKEIKVYDVKLSQRGYVDCVEDFLRAKVKSPEKIKPYVREGTVVGWGNLEMDNEGKEAVERHRGIENVETAENLDSLRLPDGVPRRFCRDVQLYNAMASMGSDVKKTEEFLRSRVQKPDEMRRHEWGQSVTGWWNLSLDEAGKKEIELHEGIDNLELMQDIKWFKKPGRQVRRSDDVKDYLVMKKEDFDEVKMVEFLVCKAWDEKSIWPRKGDGTVTAWDVRLEAAAVKDVEQYEGVRSIRLGAKIVPF